MIVGEDAQTSQSCFSNNPATHAVVWAAKVTKFVEGKQVIEYPIKGGTINFEAEPVPDGTYFKVETSKLNTLSRQGTNNANPKIRKVNQNTFLILWTDVEKTRLMGRYATQTNDGLSLPAGMPPEFTIATGDIRAYDMEILGNSIIVAVHQKGKIQLYGLGIPFPFSLPPTIPFIGEWSNPDAHYILPNIHLSAGIDNYLLSWTNSNNRIFYVIANTGASFLTSPRKQIVSVKPLENYAQCFDDKNSAYVFVMQVKERTGTDPLSGLKILSVNASSLVESGIAPVTLFSAGIEGKPGPGPIEKTDQIINEDKGGCLACKEKNKYYYSWRFNKLIGFSNYQKGSNRLLLVFESSTSIRKETYDVIDVNKDCADISHIPTNKCFEKSYTENTVIGQTYYAFIDFTGAVLSDSYELLSDRKSNQSVSDDPSSFQVYTSSALVNESAYLEIRRIQ